MRQNLTSAVLILSLFLGISRGNVALFQSDAAEPVQVYSMQVSMLPELDQKSLSLGIPIFSGLQLAQLLEDFLS